MAESHVRRMAGKVEHISSGDGAMQGRLAGGDAIERLGGRGSDLSEP